MNELLFFAKNIRGQGATTIASDIINYLSDKNKTFLIKIISPENKTFLNKINKSENIVVNKPKRPFLNHQVQRVVDILFFWISVSRKTKIVSFDLPLFFFLNQTLYFANLNIINFDDKKKLNKLYYKFLFFILKIGTNYTKKIIVQSNYTRNELIKKIPKCRNKVTVIPPIINYHSFKKNNNIVNNNLRNITLFYPASDYPHKNHIILFKLFKDYLKKIENNKFRILCTIRNDESINTNSFIFMDEISYNDIWKTYYSVDALIFPSKLESFGLPILEAMYAGLFIVCSDRNSLGRYVERRLFILTRTLLKV